MRTLTRKKKFQPFGVLGVKQVDYQGEVPFVIGGPKTGRRYTWDEPGKQPFDQQDWNALSEDQQKVFGKKRQSKPKENEK